MLTHNAFANGVSNAANDADHTQRIGGDGMHDHRGERPPRFSGNGGARNDDDWDNRSRNSSRYYGNRTYGEDNDDSISRPRSRNRYYDREPEDYYRYHRQRYDDMRRQEDLEYYRRRSRFSGFMDPMMNQSRGVVNSNAIEFRARLEECRVRNPTGYRDWYNKYMAYTRNPSQIPFPSLPSYGAVPAGNQMHHEMLESEHRPSISSGRRSVDDFLPPYGQGEYEDPIDSGQHFNSESEPITAERMTPLKFHGPHSFAVFTPQGQLLKIKGNSGTTLELSGVKQLHNHLEEAKELENFPGPLVRGVTHKNTLIQFCQRKIKDISSNKQECDDDNFILLWEVLVLLLRQNGNIVGSDIAELLLDSTKNDNTTTETDFNEVSPVDTVNAETVEQEATLTDNRNVEEVTKEFCRLLLHGHRKVALDYAMSNDLWGHALFLSSKLDERTHANVLARFANVLPFNHPLQTLYQLLGGKQPSSVTSCIDDSFGDWKPHLAMILSNSGFRIELESKAITSLGDNLGSKNQPFAAQFCYLMAQLEFCSHSKLGPLLGYNPNRKNVIEATQMTEIYEFAKSLADSNFRLGPSFLEKKLNYVKTLIDYGFLPEAYSYCEEIASKIEFNNCDNFEKNILLRLMDIGERLKHFCEDSSLVTPKWIELLKQQKCFEEDQNKGTNDMLQNQAGNDYDHHEFNPSRNDKYQEPEYVNPVGLTPANHEELPNGDIQNRDSHQLTPVTPVDNYPIQNPWMGGNSNANFLAESSNPPRMYDMPSNGPTHTTQPFTSSNGPTQTQPFIPSNALDLPNNQMSFDPQQYNRNYTPVYQQPLHQTQHQQQPFDTNSNDPRKGQFSVSRGGDPSGFHEKKKTVRFEEEEEEMENGSKLNSKEDHDFDILKDKMFELNKNADAKSALKNVGSERCKREEVMSTQPHQNQPLNPGLTKRVNAKGAGKSQGKEESKSEPSRIWSMLSKLSLKPNNQMKLPDDKDPAIVWDPVTKTWINTKEEEDDSSRPAGPPPKDSDLGGSSSLPSMGHSMPPNVPLTNTISPKFMGDPNAQMFQPQTPYSSLNSGGGLGNTDFNANANGMNKYKLPRGARNNYVDVFNPSGTPKPNTNTPIGGMGNGGTMAVPNFFIPPAMGVTDSGPVSFLTASSENNIIQEEIPYGEGHYAANN